MADAPTLSPEASRSVSAQTWEADGRGDYTWAVVGAVDPDEAGIEPLPHM